uniref:Glycosyl transferase family 25 domain-containing protein n=1 Tax=viral metagenome TaxID=1070528 RepID=A0A6C0HY60_9ZZZZ
MKYKYTILFLISILIFACTFSVYKPIEHFTSNSDNIDCYVITLGRPEKKVKNIENQQKKIPYTIEKVDAVLGDDLDIDQLVKDGQISENYAGKDQSRKRQIGCYMSHLKVLDIIHEKNTSAKYSIIFEDDFNISENFIEQLQKNESTINNLDFDVLFLGNLLTGSKGEHVSENIYGKNEVYGTHCYLINNSNVSHIKKCMKRVDENVDLKYTRVPELKVYIMHPSIVDQARNEFESDIGVGSDIGK